MPAFVVSKATTPDNINAQLDAFSASCAKMPEASLNTLFNKYSLRIKEQDLIPVEAEILERKMDIINNNLLNRALGGKGFAG